MYAHLCNKYFLPICALFLVISIERIVVVANHSDDEGQMGEEEKDQQHEMETEELNQIAIVAQRDFEEQLGRQEEPGNSPLWHPPKNIPINTTRSGIRPYFALPSVIKAMKKKSPTWPTDFGGSSNQRQKHGVLGNVNSVLQKKQKHDHHSHSQQFPAPNLVPTSAAVKQMNEKMKSVHISGKPIPLPPIGKAKSSQLPVRQSSTRFPAFPSIEGARSGKTAAISSAGVGVSGIRLRAPKTAVGGLWKMPPTFSGNPAGKAETSKISSPKEGGSSIATFPAIFPSTSPSSTWSRPLIPPSSIAFPSPRSTFSPSKFPSINKQNVVQHEQQQQQGDVASDGGDDFATLHASIMRSMLSDAVGGGVKEDGDDDDDEEEEEKEEEEEYETMPFLKGPSK